MTAKKEPTEVVRFVKVEFWMLTEEYETHSWTFWRLEKFELRMLTVVCEEL